MSFEEDKIKMETIFQKFGQDHVFAYWKTLSDEQKSILIQDLTHLDVSNIKEIFDKTLSHKSIAPTSIEPIREFSRSIELSSDIFSTGINTVLNGSVGLLLVAGGQGTRLSSTQPKGMYDIGLPSSHSLFQIQAERLLSFQRKSNKTIFWYIMTSSFTYDETVNYFRNNKYFGLSSDQVIFFNQNNFPCLDLNGKILMSSSFQVSWAPNGNGGMYRALYEQGILSHMKKHGVEWVHLYCVDNVLVKILDPALVGLGISKDVEFVAKVVPKRAWNEGVGVFGLKDGKLNVIEYSEISEEMAKKEVDGHLEFNHSNFVNFLYRLDFLEKCATMDLPYHIAKKKIPYYHNGELITPSVENGIKLELFNFDVCPSLTSFAVLLVERDQEFSPLKNHIGKDSPDSCKADLSNFNISILKKLGIEVIGEGICEVSPLWDFSQYKGHTIQLPCYLK